MRIPPLISRLLFRPTLGFTLLKTRGLKLEAHWTAIDRTLILGALPARRDVARFPDLHISGVINLCAEWNGCAACYERIGVEQLYLPTPDFTAPDFNAVRRGVDFIARFAAAGQRVYCHCKAGRGRSATIAVAWLIHSQGLTPQAAEQYLIARRPQVNRGLASRDAVIRFARTVQPALYAAPADASAVPARPVH